MPVLKGLANSAGMGFNPRSRIVNPIISTVILNEDNKPIGYLQNFSITSNRAVNPQRHFDLFDAGRIVELTYGPENLTITASGLVLYPISPAQVTFGISAELKAGSGLELGVTTTANLRYSSKAAQGQSTMDRMLPDSFPSPAFFLNLQFVPFTIKRVTYFAPSDFGVAEIYRDCLLTNYSRAYNINNTTVVDNVSITVSTWDIEYGTAEELGLDYGPDILLAFSKRG